MDNGRVSSGGAAVLGVFLAVLGLGLLLATFWSWRLVEQTQALANSKSMHVHTLVGTFSVTRDGALLVLAIAASGVGGFVHAATSFADFVGNQTLRYSWIWWYLLRALIAAGLAVLFYFAIRAGFLSTGSTAKDVNPFGVAAIAGLTGLFSKQATDKLSEVFATVFKTDPKHGDALREDSLK